ncbi:30S ribosomal protein S8 [bacterium DOLZORAL124_38_8]|nr:MAG: 30S ribosomal protein S8 [bacterium DOLZORAL124_38_8]
MVDPIADFLTRIRNAQMARRTSVSAPYSKIKHEIANVMKKNGFLADVKKDESEKFPKLEVTFVEGKTVNLERVSKCGQRIYSSSEDLRKVLNGLGISVVTTSQGVMTGYEARAKKIGGEVLCHVW